MIIDKLENKNIKKLTLNSKNSIGEQIKYDMSYFKELENLETIALNGFYIDDEMIEKLNCLKNLKLIIFNHCKFICCNKLINNIENVIITYSDPVNCNIFKEKEYLKEIKLIGIDEVDINDLIQLKNLEEIFIYNSKIKNSQKINEFYYLKRLGLDGSLVDIKNFYNIIRKDIEFSYNENYLPIE